MTEQAVEETELLLQRLDRLERELRGVRMASLLLVLVLVGFAFMIHTGQLPLKTHSVRVIDEKGDTRLFLSADSQMGSSLAMFDEQGELRVALGVSDGWPDLAFYDERGKPRVGLSLHAGGPTLRFNDAARRPRLFTGILRDQPILRLYDENEKILWSATP